MRRSIAVAAAWAVGFQLYQLTCFKRHAGLMLGTTTLLVIASFAQLNWRLPGPNVMDIAGPVLILIYLCVVLVAPMDRRAAGLRRRLADNIRNELEMAGLGDALAGDSASAGRPDALEIIRRGRAVYWSRCSSRSPR